MTVSTVHTNVDATIAEFRLECPQNSLRNLVQSEWRNAGSADLIASLKRHPTILRDRGLLVRLAIEEYKSARQIAKHVDVEQHCDRFREFGSSVHQSIFMQLLTESFVADHHPAMREAVRAPDWPEVGELFSHFHIQEVLGYGGIARVYLSLDRNLGNREVVIKVAPFSNGEASILGRLDHPNIIPIHSTGFVGNQNLHYLCTPYLGRSTLADVLHLAFHDGFPRGDDPIREAATRWLPEAECPNIRPKRIASITGRRSYVDGVLALAVPIADALSHAHRHRIVHGDLKPSNVLLTPAARPILLDFNLSKDFANSCGALGGTLPYMPPEHLRLIAGETFNRHDNTFDPSPDIYSFGALLYELLKGAKHIALPSRENSTPDAAKRILEQLQQRVAPIRNANPLVSQGLEALIVRCLAIDPGDRPRSMAEVATQLKVESRILGSALRTVRVRPYYSSIVVGIPAVAILTAASYFALRPAAYLRDYERGLQLSSSGQLSEAASYFSASARSNSSYTPAKFQLARVQLANGDIDSALSGFGELASRSNDSRSMCCVGYCFNMKRVPEAAIRWYEKAIENGDRSVATYNNLGISYLQAYPQLPPREQFELAELRIRDALTLDPSSVKAQINLVRCVTSRSNVDSDYDPSGIWSYANTILKRDPNDRLVRLCIANWYKTVKHRETAAEQKSPDVTRQISSEEKDARLRFEEVCRSQVSAQTSGFNSETANFQPLSTKNRQPTSELFIKPDYLSDIQL